MTVLSAVLRLARCGRASGRDRDFLHLRFGRLLGAPARANADPLTELQAHALQLAGITIGK
jgi:hypothetical protein